MYLEYLSPFIGIVGVVVGVLITHFLTGRKEKNDRIRIAQEEKQRFKKALLAEVRHNEQTCEHNVRRIEELRQCQSESPTRQTYPSWIPLENQMGRHYLWEMGKSLSDNELGSMVNYVVQVEHVNRQIELLTIPYKTTLNPVLDDYYLRLLGITGKQYLNKTHEGSIRKTLCNVIFDMELA